MESSQANKKRISQPREYMSAMYGEFNGIRYRYDPDGENEPGHFQAYLDHKQAFRAQQEKDHANMKRSLGCPVLLLATGTAAFGVYRIVQTTVDTFSSRLALKSLEQVQEPSLLTTIVKEASQYLQ